MLTDCREFGEREQNDKWPGGPLALISHNEERLQEVRPSKR